MSNKVLTCAQRDAKYSCRINASLIALAEAKEAMKKTFLDCIKEEAAIRGATSCKLPKGSEPMFLGICLEVQVQNGKARVLIDIDDDSYTATELNGHFIEQTPSYNGPAVGILFCSANTPCELFQDLLGFEAEYPIGPPPAKKKPCSICDGAGTYYTSYSYGNINCLTCNGTGMISLI